jgi:hypothetical protein
MGELAAATFVFQGSSYAMGTMKSSTAASALWS